jgi:RNA polymerase sigma factor (sigma-70 family)
MHPDAMIRELNGLRGLARSLVYGDTEADDLMQDAAVAMITHPPETDRPLKPWLATVIRNRWRMNRRTERRREARDQAVATALGVAAQDIAEDQAADRARCLERLSSALVALEEPFKSTVIRRYLDD